MSENEETNRRARDQNLHSVSRINGSSSPNGCTPRPKSNGCCEGHDTIRRKRMPDSAAKHRYPQPQLDQDTKRKGRNTKLWLRIDAHQTPTPWIRYVLMATGMGFLAEEKCCLLRFCLPFCPMCSHGDKGVLMTRRVVTLHKMCSSPPSKSRARLRLDTDVCTSVWREGWSLSRRSCARLRLGVWSVESRAWRRARP